MIDARNIVKTFHDGEREFTVLKGVSLTVSDGEFVAVMGRSGAGKSTLLYQLSLLDEPTSGTITLNNIPTESLDNDERTKFRLNHLGYVFQDYAIVPDLTALENVAVPVMMQGYSKKVAFEKAGYALARVGLADRFGNLPSQLSGGEQQRVSIARAIVNNPKIIFADEPTANLDSETGRRVIELFKELNEKGQTIVMVTHEEEYGAYAQRTITLSDGIITSDTKKALSM